MKKDQSRLSENVDDRQGAFHRLKNLIFGLPKEAFDAQRFPPLAEYPDPNQGMKQDRVTPGNAAWDRQYPFKQGMESAQKSARTRTRYMGSFEPGLYERDKNEWRAGEAWTTRKQDAPAGMSKRDKPTASDAMDHVKKKAWQTYYPTATKQRQLELERRRAMEQAANWEKGVGAAQKAAKQMMKSIERTQKYRLPRKP